MFQKMPSSQYLFILAVALFLVACGNDLEEAKLVASRANVNIETGKEVVINYSDNGITRIRAKAPTATRFNKEKPYMEFGDGIHLQFFDDKGNVESTLTAKYATAVENSQEMTVRDSIVVVNQKGERLTTDELIWDEEKKIIYSNTFVKIATEDEVIYGKGMIANQNFSDYTIKNITGKIKVNANEVPQ
jgi:LPS export ABC transporter protein LptC